MPDQTSRDMMIYDSAIVPRGVHGQPPTAQFAVNFIPLMRAVKEKASAGNPLCDTPDNRGRMLYLMDMDVQPRKNVVFFVWTLADPNAATQMYLNRGRAQLRSASKDDDEDVAISSHLVIDFNVAANLMRYPTGFEDNEGISRTRVKALLATLLKDSLGEVEAVIDEGITKKGLANIIIDSRPGKIIRDSELKPFEIEMVKQIPRRQLTADGMELYREVSDRRVLRLVREGSARQLQSEMVQYVTRLRRRHPDYRVRVRWRDANDTEAPDQVTKADPLERPERLLERALSHTVTLDGFRSLPDATATVIPALAERMIKELRRVTVEDRRRLR